MGGSDTSTNIEVLTVEDHAEKHRLLYERYGFLEDKIAWLGLSGQVSKKEIISMVLRLAGQKGKGTLIAWQDRLRGSTYEEIYGITKAQQQKNIRSIRFTGANNPQYNKKHTDEWRKKHSEQMSGSNHPLYGKPLSEETKRKISESERGKTLSQEQKNLLRLIHTGRKNKPETIEKMRIKAREREARKRRNG